MKKILFGIFIFALLLPGEVLASGNDLKAAFIRKDDLWIQLGGKETRITNEEFIRYPKWSHDGRWVAYLKSNTLERYAVYRGELWLYYVKSNRHFKVAADTATNFQWAPKYNAIAFQVNKTLYLLDTAQMTQGHSLTSNIENFSWLPNGKGLITSSKESLALDSDIVLSNVLLRRGVKPLITHFYTVPVEKDEYFVSTSQFQWSKSGKWLSFLLVPTASLSADANTLCVLSSDGKVFQKVGEMLNDEEWVQWAPLRDSLAFIKGSGREAVNNKKLGVLKLPVMVSDVLTPQGYTDRDIAWQNDDILYVSSSGESEWVDVEKRPLPSLFKLNVADNRQTKLTSPSVGKGDFEPETVGDYLVWIRTNRHSADMLVSLIDPLNEKLWIKDISMGSYFYEKWNWDEVFCLYREDERVEKRVGDFDWIP